MTEKEESLDEVFSPYSVAVIGASESTSNNQRYTRRAVECLKEAGFPAIYPVNPNRSQVLGLPCYPSLSAIPGAVDHVIIAVPAEAALAVLDECAAKGVKSVHFFTAGFSESGYAERAELEKAMLQKAKSGGFRIIGPNCMGIYVPGRRLTTWSNVPLEPGPIGLFSQSGGFAEDIPFYGSHRGLGFSKVISYGNGLDVGESELLEYFMKDTETEIIAAYIEGVRDGRRFVTALKEAAARKPVVIHKGGTTRAGKRATRSHTASLAGSADIFRSLCRQMNVIQVDSEEEMLDMMVALRFTRPVPKGTGVGLVGQGGGISVFASDETEAAGLNLPPLPAKILTELEQVLPLAGSILANPIDAVSLKSPEVISSTMRVLGKVSDVSLFIYHLGFHPSSRWGDGRLTSEDFLESFTAALREVPRTTGKPVILALNPPLELEGMKDFLTVQEALIRAGIPVFYSLRRAGIAMARLVAWNNRRVSH